MLKRAWRWLLHRHQPQPIPSGVSRGLAAYLATSARRQAVFDLDMADDPAMCAPAISKPTQRITRIIDQGETLLDDLNETRTMETFIIY